jgi:hypothetical protein
MAARADARSPELEGGRKIFRVSARRPVGSGEARQAVEFRAPELGRRVGLTGFARKRRRQLS